MKRILLYGSKHETTKEVANDIMQSVPDVEVQEASKFNGNINQYDLVIIGSPLYIGKMNKDCIKVLKEIHSPETKVILFLLGLAKDKWQESVEQNIESCTLSMIYSCFIGGKLRFPNMGFMEKTIIKMVNKEAHFINDIDIKKEYDLLDYTEIDKLKKEIQKYNK